ncbi:MAG TPA: DUF294 nucleotidyltransferase-like domain-containing protein [Xanthobacteraceae bacterium]|nr:DUF294 nucleotidyltransferase-like domain-containing protein [Xanthobacteraceae bacterium]
MPTTIQPCSIFTPGPGLGQCGPATTPCRARGTQAPHACPRRSTALGGAGLGAELPAVAEGLLAEGVDARTIAAVISRELGALTRRAGLVAEARMQAAGERKSPVPYALLVLGSAGRGESLLAMDQDNAIVFATGDPGGPEDFWFAAFGGHVADILHEVGVPYCTGGVMAKNAAWRGSAATWRARVGEWVRRARPEDLLSVDIFYDLRAVHGDGVLAAALWRDAYDAARGEFAFLKLLAEAAGPVEPPLGLFGLRTENGRVDLKRGGSSPSSPPPASLPSAIRSPPTPRRRASKASRPRGPRRAPISTP